MTPEQLLEHATEFRFERADIPHTPILVRGSKHWVVLAGYWEPRQYWHASTNKWVYKNSDVEFDELPYSFDEAIRIAQHLSEEKK